MKSVYLFLLTVGACRLVPSAPAPKPPGSLPNPPKEDPRCEPGSKIQSLNPDQEDEPSCQCGNANFRPSQQTCCSSVLYDIPVQEADCCGGRAELKNNHSCMGECGGTPFNRATHLCCGNNVVKFNSDSHDYMCCGTKVINPDTHKCCEGIHPIDKTGPFACCPGYGPYYTAAMECGEARATLTPGYVFDSRAVCNEELVRWGADWPSIATAPHMIQVSGLVQGCEIKNYTDHVTIPLVYTITRRQGEPVHTCLTDRSIRLVVVHAKRQRCISGVKAKRYLGGKSLEIFVNESAIECDRKRPIVRLHGGDKALVLISQRFRAMYKNAEGLSRKMYRD